MIVSFRSKALERFWWKGETRRIDPRHIAKLRIFLHALELAADPSHLDQPGYRFHSLSGDQAGRYSLRLDKNWRITFGWNAPDNDALDVDYEDYH